MNRRNSLAQSWSWRFAVLPILGMLLSATAARAGCVALTESAFAPLANASPSPSLGQDKDGTLGQPATIVGLWYVVYTANYVSPAPGPLPLPTNISGFTFAETFKTWHADGTEWEERIGPPPGGGFCFGVWKHTAEGSAKLHHVGVIYAPDGSIGAIFYEDEVNRVSPDGKTYNGTFDFKIYDGTDVLGTGAVRQEIKGTTMATRIAVH